MPREPLSSTEYRQRHVMAQTAIDRAVEILSGDAGNRILNRSYGRVSITIHYNDGRAGDVVIEQSSILRHSDAEPLPEQFAKPINVRKSGDSIDRGAEGA
jgi:hypothetical protein